MKAVVILFAALAVASTVPAAPSQAGPATADVYSSEFRAVDREGRAYTVTAVVDDRAGGTQLVLEILRRCPSCKPDVYVKTLEDGELQVSYTSFGTECQCLMARVRTKFGGKDLVVEWAWDPEQGGDLSPDTSRWAAVTANTLLNVSCYGDGTAETTPDALSGNAPQPPPRAKSFPKKLPPAFRADPLNRPGCHVETP